MKTLVVLFCLTLVPFTAVAADAPSSAAAHSARFTLDTPIETLMATPGAKAVVDKHLPDLADNPHYFMFKKGSLKDLAAKTGGSFNAQVLAKMQVELAAVP